MRPSFLLKMALTMCLLSVCVTGICSYLFYSHTKETLLIEVGTELLAIGQTSRQLFGHDEQNHIRRLHTKIQNLPHQKKSATNLLSKQHMEELSNTPEYKGLTHKLKTIQHGANKGRQVFIHDEAQLSYDLSEEPIVHNVYLLLPQHLNKKFINLANSENKNIDYNHDGRIEDSERGIPISALIDATNASISASQGHASFTHDFYENNRGTWVSAALPIVDEDKKIIAILGINFDVSNKASALSAFKITALHCTYLSLVLAILLSLVIAKQLHKPIKALTSAASKVAAGDYSAQAEVHSNDQLGILANTFNHMVGQVREHTQELGELNAAYERFVPKEFLEQLGLDDIKSVQLGDQISKQMTVMFCDIRSYAALSEELSTQENFTFINDYLSKISPIVRQHHGFIDKYIGDSIMSLFPGPATNAIEAAIHVIDELHHFNDERKAKGLATIKIATSIHSGNLVLGTIGEERRMEATVIADTVNIAARLENIAKKLETNTLFTEETLNSLDKENKYHYRYIGQIAMRGIQHKYKLFELLDNLEPEQLEKRNATTLEFAGAMTMFDQGNFQEAAIGFKQVINFNGNDTVAHYYLQKCETQLNNRR